MFQSSIIPKLKLSTRAAGWFSAVSLSGAMEEVNSAGVKDNITVVCLKYRKEAAYEQ